MTVTPTKQKTLILDIETAPIIAYVWDLKVEHIGLNQIKKDWHIMAWAAKWLDDPASKIMYQDQRNSKPIENDKTMLEKLWLLLDEADIVVTQNGKKFDGPKLTARFMLHGMTPPSPYRHLDTYLIVKQTAKFTSNKLEYLTNKLCVKYKKLTHGRFPGMSLWDQCLEGNRSAWDEMKRYNIHDVLSTEELYNKIRAWAPDNMPKPYTGTNCRICDGPTEKRGFGIKKGKLVQRIHCLNIKDCGAWDSTAILKEKKNGRNFVEAVRGSE